MKKNPLSCFGLEDRNGGKRCLLVGSQNKIFKHEKFAFSTENYFFRAFSKYNNENILAYV